MSSLHAIMDNIWVARVHKCREEKGVNVLYGLGAAIMWALDTTILSIALSSSPFISSAEAIALSSFISTFLHDAISSCFLFIYICIKHKISYLFDLFKSKATIFLVLAAIIGAPVGMSGYVFAIKNIGPAYTGAITAFFPATGAFLAHVFLKEQMKNYNWAGLAICILSVVVIGFNPSDNISGNWTMGLLGAGIATVGWGSEAVLVAYALKKHGVDEECCLFARQIVSTLTYAFIILPFFNAWPLTIDVSTSSVVLTIGIAAVCGTLSYLMYYKAIGKIGAIKAMSLDISFAAWTIPISFLLLGTLPSTLAIICAFTNVAGSILAAKQ